MLMPLFWLWCFLFYWLLRLPRHYCCRFLCYACWYFADACDIFAAAMPLPWYACCLFSLLLMLSSFRWCFSLYAADWLRFFRFPHWDYYAMPCWYFSRFSLLSIIFALTLMPLSLMMFSPADWLLPLAACHIRYCYFASYALLRRCLRYFWLQIFSLLSPRFRAAASLSSLCFLFFEVARCDDNTMAARQQRRCLRRQRQLVYIFTLFLMPMPLLIFLLSFDVAAIEMSTYVRWLQRGASNVIFSSLAFATTHFSRCRWLRDIPFSAVVSADDFATLLTPFFMFLFERLRCFRVLLRRFSTWPAGFASAPLLIYIFSRLRGTPLRDADSRSRMNTLRWTDMVWDRRCSRRCKTMARAGTIADYDTRLSGLR